jgi:hypothetical protein
MICIFVINQTKLTTAMQILEGLIKMMNFTIKGINNLGKNL